MEEMNKKQLIKEWLLKNCVNAKGHLDLAHLDFSDFEGDVYINHMKVILTDKNYIYTTTVNTEEGTYRIFTVENKNGGAGITAVKIK